MDVVQKSPPPTAPSGHGQQLPAPHVGTPGEWSTGLYDCFSDVSNCCITCWCPCITFGQIAELVDKGSTSWAVSGALYTLICFVTGCACIYSCIYRARMRKQYMLAENPCADCLVHCCCETCALCQEYRELKNRGFDMTIGDIDQHLGALDTGRHDDLDTLQHDVNIVPGGDMGPEVHGIQIDDAPTTSGAVDVGVPERDMGPDVHGIQIEDAPTTSGKLDVGGDAIEHDDDLELPDAVDVGAVPTRRRRSSRLRMPAASTRTPYTRGTRRTKKK